MLRIVIDFDCEDEKEALKHLQANDGKEITAFAKALHAAYLPSTVTKVKASVVTVTTTNNINFKDCIYGGWDLFRMKEQFVGDVIVNQAKEG